jgi:hypothetical protein
LGNYIFQYAATEYEDPTKTRLTENIALALDNPSDVLNDYLHGYREYLKNLTSLPTIYMGCGDDAGDTVKDDGSEECKRLFQRIRSQSVKSVFPKDRVGKKYSNSRRVKAECKSSTAHTQQLHSQSGEIGQIYSSSVTTHNKEEVLTKIRHGAEDNDRTNICHFIFNEPTQNPKVTTYSSSNGGEIMFVETTAKAEHFTEHPKEKILSQSNLPLQTNDISSVDGRPCTQKEVDNPSHLQDANSRPPVQKPKTERRKAKKLRDLSEKQPPQSVEEKKANQSAKDRCISSNAR